MIKVICKVTYDTENAELIKKNTRNYAKRQITFFKRLEGLNYLDANLTLDELTNKTIELLNN